MYQKFYGFCEPPFDLTPNPRFVYFSDTHREAYAQMVLGIEMRKGFIVLTGEVGTGKTTLLRTLLENLDDTVKYAYVYHTLVTAKGLLHQICREFGIETHQATKAELIMKLHDFLYANYSSGRNAVLIIDEAQDLRDDFLEEVRLLSNFETSSTKLLQIILAGQPELAVKLDDPGLRQLKQRVGLRFHLRRFSRPETIEYTSHRLSVAAAEVVGDIFTADAMESVYDHSEGVPRRVNILCDNALVMGYVSDRRQIDRDIIEQAAREGPFRDAAEYHHPGNGPIAEEILEAADTPVVDITSLPAVRDVPAPTAHDDAPASRSFDLTAVRGSTLVLMAAGLFFFVVITSVLSMLLLKSLNVF